MTVLANIAVPSIADHIVIMLLLLIPIAFVEGLVIARRHALSAGESFVLSIRANFRSTLVGLPLGYLFALTGVIPVGVFAASLPGKIPSAIAGVLSYAVVSGGRANNELNQLGFCLGTLLVMVPYYLFTVTVERKLIAKLNPDWDRKQLSVTVRIMNVITYGILATPLLVGAVRSAIALMT